LRASGYTVAAERARRDAGAQVAPLSLEGEIENFAGSGSLGGTGAAEVSLRLSRLIERGDKLRLRTELGDSLVDRAQAEAALARIDLAAEVTRRYIQALIDEARLDLSLAAVDLANETLTLVRRRVDVGRSSDAELATAENGLAQAELSREAFRRQHQSDLFHLLSLWSGTEPAPVLAPADLSDLPALEPFEAMRGQIDQSPDLLRLFSEQRVLAAERRVAESRGRSDISLGIGARYLAEPQDAGLVVSFAMPFGSRERSAPLVAEVSARTARVPELIEQRRLELGAMLFAHWQQLQFERDRHARLTSDMLPRAEKSVDLYRQGFELGSVSLLEFTEAQRELISLQQAALAAAANFHLTLVDVEQLLGSVDPNGASR
jgi:cobalt-zinc-cadmium efflux system outer membrane protein